MFTNLLFIIIVLLLINFTFEVPVKPLIDSPEWGFSLGILFYIFLLGLILFQNRLLKRTCYRHPSRMLILVNLELILFLCVFHFLFGALRIFEWPSQALITVFSLSLYLFALWAFHYSKQRAESPCAEAFMELRMVVPFTIPFLIFTVIIDLLNLAPFQKLQVFLNPQNDNLLLSSVLFALSGAFLILMMIFFPPLLIWIWKCKPMQNSPLKERLHALCQRARFKHGGMRIWTIMPSMTAAIIGIVPRLRYVIFTEGLLNTLSPESVEAVLAHEIGHSYRKHLVIYPFIIFGMLVCIGFFSLFFANPLAFNFSLQNLLYPSPLWDALYPILIFLAYAAIIVLYFRFIFGFFSRQFERQADLHVFEVNIAGEAMKKALYDVAYGMGIPPSTPSWHHYSIQQRVDFLNQAIQNPSLIPRHHKKVKILLASYFSLMGLAVWFLFHPIGDVKIDEWLNQPLRKTVAWQFMEKYHLQGNPRLIENAFVQSLTTEAGVNIPGVVEFVSARILLNQNQLPAAAALMNAAWDKYDIKNASPEIRQAFEQTTRQILKQKEDPDLEKQLNISDYQTYFQENRNQILDEYLAFLRFPSISSEKEHTQDLRACANWLVDRLKSIGFETELWETSGHPVIYASHLKAGPEKPTLLIYNHYDVQPVDPLELWEFPPFEPTIKEGNVYARGAQDNKGQCFYVIQALKAILEKEKKFPLNIKLCIEGEEEFASTGLSQILSQKEKELNADYLAIVDVGIRDLESPAITLGVRGLCTMDVEVTASKTDLHSGSHGGIAYNPIHALNEILASLRDSNGKITVPGFYDAVKEMTDHEKKQFSFSFDAEEYRKNFGIQPTGGEKGYSPLERAWMRPTIEINGIAGGYAGSGFKTVIPAKAIAKLSCRLVPDQDPHQIASLVSNFIQNHAPDGVNVSVNLHQGSGKAKRANPGSKAVLAFAKAYEEVFQKPCAFIMNGGSIPIVTELAETSKGELVLLGLGLPGDQIHAPNEHFGLDRLEKGFLIMVQGLHYLS